MLTYFQKILSGVCMVFAVFAACPLSWSSESSIPLMDGRKSLCTIVVNYGSYPSAEASSQASEEVNWFDSDITDDTICTESFAAAELRSYLCRITGLDPYNPENFPIRDDDAPVQGAVILVGNVTSNKQCAPFASELTVLSAGKEKPGPESFTVKTLKQGGSAVILLSGFDRVGTLYAVYDFLAKCGVRWFSPGLAGEAVPKKENLSVPFLAYSDYPRFTLRGFWVEFFVPEHTHVVPEGKKGTIDFFNWMAHNRMNLWSSGEQAVPHGELKKRGFHLNAGGHTFYLLLDPNAPYPYNHPRFSGDESKPADPYPAGDSYSGDVNKDGILTYSEAHPEWYGLGPDGQRKFPTDPFGWNFCTSNGDMVKEFIRNLTVKLASGEWKYADYLDWWPEDINRWCACESCKKLGSPTDRNILMAYQIRQGLQAALRDGKLKRDIKVNFLFYSGSGVIDPPTRPLPADFDYDATLATFFPIVRCYVHNFDDPACTEYNKKYFDYLRAWQASPYYKGKFMIGEYYNISGYRDLPILYTKVMEHDIRYFYESGARAMHYMHTPIGNWGPRAVTNYQFASMLWNPYTDVPKLLDEYFTLRYENTSQVMRLFYSHLEKAMINVPVYKYQLNTALHDFSNGETDTVFRLKHLHLEVYHPETDDGPDMVETIYELNACEQAINRAHTLMLPLKVSERVRKCILEDEGLFRYGDATVRFYYHMARSTIFPLKSPQWRQEIERASHFADLLDSQPVGYAAFYGGTMGMMRNALEASYIKDVYVKWRGMIK